MSSELNKNAIILCGDTKILDILSYQEMINISQTLKDLFAKSINNENICLGLLMNHNIYIPSIILSLQKLKHAFVFLTSRNLNNILTHLKCIWILSLGDIKEIPLFQEVDKLTLDGNIMILWKRCGLVSTNFNFHNIFCIVETSGSTGDNKLIRVTRTCIETNASDLRRALDLKNEDIIFWGTSLTFDPSIIELMLALQSGACLVIVPYKVSINPRALYKALFDVANVTFLQMVPSVFLRWNENEIKQILLHSKLRILAFGGEHFPNRILSYERGNDLRIFNLYGISEVSCWATLHEITNENHNDDIPIGKNLQNTIVELRNEFGKVIDRGKGEIFVGSSSRICYINAESPSDISGTVFRETGDIAEIKEKGIVLVGRKNKVIKRFGHRVNLTKMEKKIFGETGLENRCIWSQKNSKILTFILLKNFDIRLKEKILDKLRIKLINILSEECFPDFIDIITNYPLTCHGKINEKALENLYSITKIAASHVDTFRLLWCRYAGISIEMLDELKHYTFFEMGGNSISAMQLLTEFKEIINCQYPQELVTMIFENGAENCINYLKSIEPLLEPLKEKSTKNRAEEYTIKKRKICDDNLKILWMYDLKACVDSSPLVFEFEKATYIAVGSFSHKFVVFRENGEVVYEIILPDSVESTPSISPCGHYILVGCFNGVLYCLDFVKKQLVWEFATCDRIKSSVCFSRKQSAVVFGSYDKNIYCLSITGGSKLWSTLLDGSISSSPIYNENNKVVYVATTKGTCFCLKEEDGQILWTNCCRGPIFGTPCMVNANESIIFATVHGILYCLQQKNGEELWKYEVGGHIFSSLVSYKDCILFGCHDKNLHVFSVSDCTLVKKVMVGSETSTTPFAYNTNGNDVIVTACNSGLISVIDFNTFEILKCIQLPGEIFSSPFVHRNKIYVGCRDNKFYCIELNK